MIPKLFQALFRFFQSRLCLYLLIAFKCTNYGYCLKFRRCFFFFFEFSLKLSVKSVLVCQTSVITGEQVRKKARILFLQVERLMECLFQTVTVTIKSGFEPYTKKIIKKKTNIFFLIQKRKPKDKVSYWEILAKMKCQSLKATQR